MQTYKDAVPTRALGENTGHFFSIFSGYKSHADVVLLKDKQTVLALGQTLYSNSTG